MNTYGIILFFKVDFSCAYAEFDVQVYMSSTNELISMNVDLVKLYFGKINFVF